MLIRSKFALIAVIYNLFLLWVAFICILGPLEHHPRNLFETIVFLIIFFLGISTLLMLVNGFVTARHFDRKFKEMLVNDQNMNAKIYSPALSGKMLINISSTRASLYSFCVVFPRWARKVPFYRSWFDDYDFRKNARWIDWLFSYLFIAASFAFLGLTLLATLVKIIQWIV